jgi:ankyrin repeat protein
MIKMDSIIKNHFQNSKFYKNYGNVNNVLLRFKNIKSKYNQSKLKFKKRSINIENKLDENIIENYNYNFLYHTTINDQYYINCCNNILNMKIKISHNIKKYVKYARNIHSIFIETVKIGIIKNVKFLVKNGIDIHFNNDKALIYSCNDGNIEIVKFLIDYGADVNTQNNSALYWSIKNGHDEIVNILIENGADIQAYNEIKNSIL